MQGHRPGKLTDLGITQAKMTGKRLRKINFDAIYCSDLFRTKETLDAIMSGFKSKDDIPIEYTSSIREKGGGILEGLPLDVFKENAQKSNLGVRKYKPEGGESWEDVHSRASNFID